MGKKTCHMCGCRLDRPAHKVVVLLEDRHGGGGGRGTYWVAERHYCGRCKVDVTWDFEVEQPYTGRRILTPGEQVTL